MRTTFTFFFPTPYPDNYLGIAEDCVAELVDIELAISPYQEGSDVHRLNSSAGTGEWVRVGWPTYALLQLCVDVMIQTNGAFNPFDGHRTMRVSGKVLDEKTSRMLQEEWHGNHSSSVPLEFDDTHPKCRLSAGFLIDLGAIGKGWALDKCAAMVLEAGVKRAFLNAGGSSMVAIGADWLVTIAGIDQTITLSNKALSVSRRVNADAGGIHIVSSALPADDSDMVSRVIGDTCALTDALSTAAIAGGTDLRSNFYNYDVAIKSIPGSITYLSTEHP